MYSIVLVITIVVCKYEIANNMYVFMHTGSSSRADMLHDTVTAMW